MIFNIKQTFFIKLHTNARVFSALSLEFTKVVFFAGVDDWLPFAIDTTDDALPFLLLANARRFCCHTWLNC